MAKIFNNVVQPRQKDACSLNFLGRNRQKPSAREHRLKMRREKTEAAIGLIDMIPNLGTACALPSKLPSEAETAGRQEITLDAHDCYSIVWWISTLLWNIICLRFQVLPDASFRARGKIIAGQRCRDRQSACSGVSFSRAIFPVRIPNWAKGQKRKARGEACVPHGGIYLNH